MVDTAPSVPAEGGRALVARLRAQGLSIRAISERTGIPRSTVGDHVIALGETARPEHVVGRDGRRYRPVREPRDHVAEVLRQELLDTIASGRAACPRDRGDRTLQRLLVVDQLRMVARSVVDAAPFSDTERDVTDDTCCASGGAPASRRPREPSAGSLRTRGARGRLEPGDDQGSDSVGATWPQRVLPRPPWWGDAVQTGPMGPRPRSGARVP